MVFMTKNDSILLNYLIAELKENEIEFRFADPFYNQFMHWVSAPDDVALVDQIVREANTQKASVYIGIIDRNDGNDYIGNRSAMVIGYVQENKSC